MKVIKDLIQIKNYQFSENNILHDSPKQEILNNY